MTGAHEAAGRVIAGRYRLVRQLGSGGMGRVWLAYDQELACEVALKEIALPPGLTDSEVSSRIARARGEARHAARLRDHPHVVTVHDLVEDGGLPWIVMAFVPGAIDLEAVVRENGPLAPPEVARIGLAVLDALREGHRLGVLHRDVKPANILLTCPGPEPGQHTEGGRVLLADYGIALEPSSGEPRLTTTSGIIGTPPYMAPERARGEEPTPASDLFALGSTMYFAVEGTGPFERGSDYATLTALLFEDPTPPQRAAALTPVLLGLLAKDPLQRMDGEEASRRLAPIAAKPRPARQTAPTTWSSQLEHPPAARPTTPQVSVPSTVSVPPPGPAPGPPPASASPGPRPESSSWRSRRKLLPVIIAAAVVLALALGLVVLRGGTRNPSGGTTSPSPRDSAAATAEAHRIASAVALSPEDWGPDFVRNDPYEEDPASEGAIRGNCELSQKPPRAGTLSAISRTVKDDQNGFSGISEVVVYADEDTARKSISDDRDTIHQCTIQHSGKIRWDDVHEAIAPKLSGFDEVVAEEGTLATYEDGSKANLPYTELTGRIGRTTLSAYLVGSTKKEEVRKKSTDSLLLMRRRLSEQSTAASDR
ncbi:serine/threonine protein kinase [Streptomyces actinomycinicus]|uniref:non-specific serine/threonine protein kinase n=1 Tax=Streptomyces actinomycinicus TaxID=1695166 RepID=A0A937EHR4_9ACTN|nr:serine/threonine-protein kinase [Streptomyces actinomycinicus]MBL1082259.1 serine/threonine protein kinase [Streptomyces actinomycinicus]